MTKIAVPRVAPWIGAFIFLSALLLGGAGMARAGDNPFASGWTLQSAGSSLNFQSVKNVTNVESSSFASFTGSIDAQGNVTLKIALDSVDTKVDLRNVRMRFLMFETFQFPDAVITAKIDPASVADLGTVRRKTIRLPYTMVMHGVTRSYTADVVATLLGDDLVVISTSTPISVPAADFGLEAGVRKLEEAANVVIIPSATVTFDFTFARNGTAAAPEKLAAAPAAGAPVVRSAAPTPDPAAKSGDSTALETKGNFDIGECKGRFEILSRAGNIYFPTASARLDEKSAPLLNSLVDIIKRCPGLTIEVSGHTDSDGSAASNMVLSKERAESVTAYLIGKGVDAARVKSVGYGETHPVAPNDNAEDKARNRRIEFAVMNG